jgi:hypothetical protein
MAITEEEMDRRRKVMAEARTRANQMFKEIEEHHQQRLAAAIHASIASAGESVSVDEAIEMLKSFDSSGEAPQVRKQAGNTKQGR